MRTGSGYLHREAFRPLLRLVTVGRRRGAGLPDCSPRCAVSWSTWPATTIVRRAQLWVLDLPIAGAAELGVTGAQMEHMPFYLRAFLRVLSSWVHRGEIVESTGSRPGLHDLSFVAASYRRTPPGGRSVLRSLRYSELTGSMSLAYG